MCVAIIRRFLLRLTQHHVISANWNVNATVASAFQCMFNCRAVCLSIRLSVTLVDRGLWSHRLEFFRNNFTVSYPGMFALCRPKHQGSTPTGTPGNFGPKWPTYPCWFERRRHSIANCGRMVTDSATVTMESLRKPPSNCAIADPLRPPLPQNGGSICPQDKRISAQRVIRCTSCLVLHCVPKKHVTTFYTITLIFNNKCPITIITIIFVIVTSKSMRHQKTVSFPTSPI